ncbi:hypothetical protein B1R94_27720 [Mycolicibacterium litorale]|nr:hypothetical protein B1R94_27720 [Mycolicibacterium litorale]
MTSYTRPTSSFDAEGGRPAGARSALLNPAELRGPTTTGPVGGSPMPMSPATAGMLGRGQGQDGKDSKDYITHARVVLDDAPQRN